MFVPIWLIVLTGLVIVILAMLAFRRGGRGDMLEEQRRNTPIPPAAPLPAADRQDDAQVMALPQVQEALNRGKKIAAIKQVRIATGMGLKESKELVERNLH